MTDRIPDDAPLSFLVGPTAAGKSELALALAEHAQAWILSLDSMQVYRGMDVGTAKPGPSERVRVPHRLIDLVDPTERYDLERYLSDAARAWREARAAGRRALFVGGTGLYLKALTHGLFRGPAVDPAVRAELNRRARAEGSPALHAELARVDPAWAARVHPHDAKRVVRGLEVFRAAGRPLSSLQGEWEVPGGGRPRRIVGVAPALDRLEERIRARTHAMLAEGWVREAEGLFARGGLGPTAGQALGYPEIALHLAGELDDADLEDRIALRTRQLARRQRTWFRKFKEIEWVDPEQPDALERALAHLGWS